MFNYNEHSVQLTPERIKEIMHYLVTMKSSHICHTTNKTCYGGLEIQSKVLYKLGIIIDPTPECLLETAKKYIND